MSMEMEFKTTQQAARLDPSPPEGEGWKFAGAVNFGSDNAHMYWQRPKKTVVQECRKCKAVAFTDGKCVGCGTTLEN